MIHKQLSALEIVESIARLFIPDHFLDIIETTLTSIEKSSEEDQEKEIENTAHILFSNDESSYYHKKEGDKCSSSK